MAEDGDQSFVPKSQKPLSLFYDGERESGATRCGRKRVLERLPW